MIVCPWYFPPKKRVVPSIRADLPDLRRPSGKLKLSGREENENGGNGGTVVGYPMSTRLFWEYMGYIWDIYGIYMGYIWDIYGIYMGYIWDIYGIYMGYIYMGYIVYVCLTFGDISWVTDIASLVDGFADSWEYQHQGTGFEHSSDRNFPKDWYFWEIPLDIFPP